MSTSSPATATLDDLYAVEGKAELIAGRIVKFMPSGFAPSRAEGKVYIRLELYSETAKSGLAFADGLGYALKRPLRSGRQSFCPDASYYTGPQPKHRMRFVDGVPILAIEVRNEGDYGEAAEDRLAAKRVDYFEAGTGRLGCRSAGAHDCSLSVAYTRTAGCVFVGSNGGCRAGAAGIHAAGG